jgi:hypothetical protein
MRLSSSRTRMTLALSACAAAIGLALSGCAVAPAPATDTTPAAKGPQLGSATLSPDVKDMTVLVVGDSLARALGAGMSEVSEGRGVTIVNAANGGCGIMLPIKQMTNGQLDDPYYCNDWPTTWPELVAEYEPDAVYLTTSFWDQAQQVIDESGAPKTFEQPEFRDRYAANVDKAIAMLTAQGAEIFMDNWDRPKNHGAQELAVERNAALGVPISLVDLFHEVCTDTTCPPVIEGINVKDETGHPAGESRDRQARFILNQIAAS